MNTLRVFILGLLTLAAPALAATTPQIQHWTLDNGARVYFVATEALPIVDVRVVFDAGAARDGELAGLAQLTNGLLDQGAGGLDAGELARRFETLGARLSGGAERDMAWLHLRSLARAEALDPGIANLALVLTKPDFPERSLERLRSQMLVGVQAVKQDPGEIASRAFYRAVYGNHPYATPPDGTEQSLKAIARGDVTGFYRRYYTAANAVIAIVGDIDRARAETIAERLSKGLPEGKAAPALPPVPKAAKPQRERIDFAATQTQIMLGQPAIDRDSPDLFPMLVGNHILGGSGLVSLLAQSMREQRGLSYSSGSWFVPSRQPGPFVIQTQVRADKTEEAIQVMREVFETLRRDGPSAEQLDAAKRNITGSFPLKLDSNGDIVGYVAMIGFYGLPLDYLETYIPRIEKVTAADVRTALQRNLDPATMTTVLVGPEPKAEPAKE